MRGKKRGKLSYLRPRRALLKCPDVIRVAVQARRLLAHRDVPYPYRRIVTPGEDIYLICGKLNLRHIPKQAGVTTGQR